MKILVLVKEVPDTYGERTLNLETGLADRDGECVLDEISERALEVALSYADANPDTEIVALTMGPERVTPSLRKCLAMGAAAAVHVLDDGLRGADLGLTAEVLAAAIRRQGFDLVLTGNQSTDGSGGMLPAMLAEHLEAAALTNLSAVTIAANEVSGERASDDATLRVSAHLPAIVSITDQLPDARFPNFKGIVAAKKKPIETLTLADLGLTADDLSAGRAIMLSIAERPARAAGVKITDEGDAGARLAAFLSENRLA